MSPSDPIHEASKQPSRRVMVGYSTCGCAVHMATIDVPERGHGVLDKGWSISGFPLTCQKCKQDATATILDPDAESVTA